MNKEVAQANGKAEGIVLDTKSYQGLMNKPKETIGKLLLENEGLKLLIFNSQEKVIIKWIT